MYKIFATHDFPQLSLNNTINPYDSTLCDFAEFVSVGAIALDLRRVNTLQVLVCTHCRHILVMQLYVINCDYRTLPHYFHNKGVFTNYQSF